MQDKPYFWLGPYAEDPAWGREPSPQRIYVDGPVIDWTDADGQIDE